MIRRSFVLSTLFVVLASVGCEEPEPATCVGTTTTLRTPGTLTVAMDYSFPPFAFRGDEGDLEGFDVDLVREVAKELRLEPSFLNRGSGALVSGVLAHRHDLAASAIRDSEKLRDEVCASASYLDADLGILVRATQAQPIDGVADLAGKTVAVLDGSRAERWAVRNLDESTIASLPATDDTLNAVRGSKADAALDENAMVRFAAKSSPEFEAAGKIETEEGFVFVASPDNAKLIERVDAALKKLRENGSLRRLNRKWFDE